MRSVKILAAAGLLATLAGCGSPPPPTTTTTTTEETTTTTPPPAPAPMPGAPGTVTTQTFHAQTTPQ